MRTNFPMAAFRPSFAGNTQRPKAPSARPALRFGGLVVDIMENNELTEQERIKMKRVLSPVKESIRKIGDTFICMREVEKEIRRITVAHVIQALTEAGSTFDEIVQGLKLKDKQREVLKKSLDALCEVKDVDGSPIMIFCMDEHYRLQRTAGIAAFEHIYPALTLPESVYVDYPTSLSHRPYCAMTLPDRYSDYPVRRTSEDDEDDEDDELPPQRSLYR